MSVVLLLLQSCSKDSISTVDGKFDNSLNLRTGDGYQYTNGLLKFDDLNSYYILKNYLEAQCQDSTAVNNAYTALGFTPSIINNDSTHIPDFPILDKFEIDLGFLSARRQEQINEFAFLNSGGEPADFNAHFLSGTLSKAFLNTDNAFQVGSRIFKYTSDGHMVVIGNSDYSILNTINNLSNNEIVEGYNLRIFDLNEKDDDAYFIFDTLGIIVSNKSVLNAKFSFLINQDTTITFTNGSFSDDGTSNFSVTYTWSFDDGAPSYVGITPPNHSFINDSVIVTLTVTDGNGNSDNYSEELLPVVCWYPFSIPVHCGSMDISFHTSSICPTVPSQCYAPDSDPNCEWVFIMDYGDGSIPVLRFGHGPLNHTYSTAGVYKVRVEVWQFCNGVPKYRACWYDAWATVPGKDIPDPNEEKCVFRSNEEDSPVKTIDNRKWKLQCKIWTERVRFNSDVGSRTKPYRKWLGVWYSKKMDKIWASLEGTYYHDANASSPCACDPTIVPFKQDWETKSQRVERNISDNGKSKKRHLWSTHKGVHKSKPISFPGKLFLE